MQLKGNSKNNLVGTNNSNKKRIIKPRLKVKNLIIPVIAVFILSTIALLNISKKDNLIQKNTKKLFESIGIYTKENKEINIQSEDWKIDKKVEWIESNKAKITYDLTSVSKYEKNNKDIVLMIDTSESMGNGKLEQIKISTINLIDQILKEDNNRIALIEFNEKAELLTEFTDDKTKLVELINSLSLNGSSDYKEPFKVLNNILQDYDTLDKDVSVLFIVGGYSNIKVNKTIYNIIKTNYIHTTINGIQFEMGSNTDELSKCTDNQIVANKENIYERLYEAVYPMDTYDTLMIDDYISKDFKINNINDIKVSNGKVNVYDEDETIITWDLSKQYVIGSHEKMEIIVSFNKDYEKEGYYPVSLKTQVQTQSEKNITSTPLVLKNYYEVSYDVNTPTGCKLENPKSQKYFVYTSVANDNNQLECDGYLFKGWKTTENVKIINDNTFIMPDKDIVVRGTWTKQSITKTMDGEVFEKTTLYKVIKEESEKNNSVVLKYKGEHNDSINEDKSTQDIYYFSANNDDDANKVLEKNNVIFGGYCWQILRTTDTGGVKLIYNGKPEKNGTCSTNREEQAGYDVRIIQDISKDYYYGTEYTYDEDNKAFKLSGDVEHYIWNKTTSEEIIGKYTCMSEKEDDTCDNLYYIESYVDEEKANILPINSKTNYSIIGISNYNKTSTSLSNIGYMYGINYEYNKTNLVNEESFIKEENISQDLVIGDKITNNNGTYTLENTETITKEQWESNYSNYKDKYTCNNQQDKCNNPKLIVNTSSDNYSYIELSDKLTISKERKDNSLVNPITVTKYELYTNNYNDYKYICNDNCKEIRYIIELTNKGYIYTNNIYYGEDVKWNGKKYILQNTIGMEKYNELSNNHYMCLENNTKECSKVAYIYYYEDNNAYYILLEDGKVSNIDEALDLMIKNNENDSEIKTIIETWYEKNLIKYQDLIEDTIYCNNRTINKDNNGWTIKGNINSLIKFKETGPNIDLKCENPTDQFSTNNELAKIKYPIGLATKSEMNLLNNDILRKTNQTYWLSSPYSYKTTAEQYQIKEDGKIEYKDLIQNSGIRPVISLKENIEFSEGDGSTEMPYIIEEKEN